MPDKVIIKSSHFSTDFSVYKNYQIINFLSTSIPSLVSQSKLPTNILALGSSLEIKRNKKIQSNAKNGG